MTAVKRLTITVPQSTCDTDLNCKNANASTTPSIPMYSNISNVARKSISKKNMDFIVATLPTPTTPYCDQLQQKYSPKQSVLLKTGCEVTEKIAVTLQGSVYKAKSKTGQFFVIKRTSVELHNNKCAIVNNKKVECSENIVKEASILNYLQTKNPPINLIKLHHFYCDKINYFMLMEDGGGCLFDHITNLHEMVVSNKIGLKHYRIHARKLIKQMCRFVYWLHYKVRFAHLDISLENLLIQGYSFKNGEIINNGIIKFIDFGLAKSFVNKKSFDGCTRYVGKKTYQSPLNYAQKPYNAAKNDVWSLGVCIFMISLGIKPYQTPTMKDEMFCNIINGYLDKYITELGKAKYIDKYLLNLMNGMLTIQKNRFNMNNVVTHQYFK